MFEAHLASSAVLKKVIDAIKNFVDEANFECSNSGIQVYNRISNRISTFLRWFNFEWRRLFIYNIIFLIIQLQAVDNSVVSVLSLTFYSDGFVKFHCDRSLTIGMNFENLTKILAGINDEDEIKLMVKDKDDKITFNSKSVNLAKVK